MTRTDEPCSEYFGNVCSGFGAACICTVCGWDLVEHKEEPLCEVTGCPASATHHIGNARGEGLDVCPKHLAELRSALVAPVVWPLTSNA